MVKGRRRRRWNRRDERGCARRPVPNQYGARGDCGRPHRPCHRRSSTARAACRTAAAAASVGARQAEYPGGGTGVPSPSCRSAQTTPEKAPGPRRTDNRARGRTVGRIHAHTGTRAHTHLRPRKRTHSRTARTHATIRVYARACEHAFFPVLFSLSHSPSVSRARTLSPSLSDPSRNSHVARHTPRRRIYARGPSHKRRRRRRRRSRSVFARPVQLYSRSYAAAVCKSIARAFVSPLRSVSRATTPWPDGTPA